MLIKPDEAVLQGAAWSVDAGTTWQDSGTTLTLDTGAYQVQFSDLQDWLTPDPQNVTILEDQNTSIKGIYVNKRMIMDFLKGRLENPEGLDVNKDGKIDIADLITLLLII